MPEEPSVPDAVDQRAQLLPEEQSVGSEDPEGQAAEILAESDARSADRDAAPDAVVERRTSADATEPPV